MQNTPAPPRILTAAADGVFDTLVGIIWLSAAATLIGVGLGTLVIGVGFFVLALTVLGIARFGDIERRRAASAYGLALPTPDRPLTARRGWLRPVSQAWLDVRGASFWRTVLHLLATFLIGLMTCGALTYLIGGGLAEVLSALLPAGADGARLGGWSVGLPRFAPIVAVPFGLVYVALGLGLLVAAYHAHRALSGSLLGLSDAEALRRDLRRASEQREGAVRVATSDRRHIERDLHDGVQPSSSTSGCCSTWPAPRSRPTPRVPDTSSTRRTPEPRPRSATFASSDAASTRRSSPTPELLTWGLLEFQVSRSG